MMAETAVMLVKKVTRVVEFSCIRKKCYFDVLKFRER